MIWVHVDATTWETYDRIYLPGTCFEHCMYKYISIQEKFMTHVKRRIASLHILIHMFNIKVETLIGQ